MLGSDGRITPEAFDLLIEAYKKDIADNEDVDPDCQEDWGSMLLGYGLGKGLTLEEARNFIDVVRDMGLG